MRLESKLSDLLRAAMVLARRLGRQECVNAIALAICTLDADFAAEGQRLRSRGRFRHAA